MRQWLLSLYPKPWREQYGEEYAALLEDTELSVAVAADVAKMACTLQLSVYGHSLSAIIAACLYAASGVACIHLGLTQNWPIWMPTNIWQAVGLMITLVPLLYACSVRLTLLRKRTDSVAFLFAAVPFVIASTLLWAFACGFFMAGSGLFGVSGGAHYMHLSLDMAVVCLGLIGLLHASKQWLLRRFAG